MEWLSKTLMFVHILAGGLSLILFWIPVLVRKGSKIHNRVGRIYVNLMWIVVVSALILSVENLLQKDYILAGFLGFLSALTAVPLWYAKAILKNKKQISQGYYWSFRALHGAIFLMGLLLVIWSLILKVQGPAILMLIFGLLGVATIPDAIRSYQKLCTGKNWIVTHLRGMLTTGIAAYTAFFAFGGRQLMGHIFTDYLLVVPWILPTIIGSMAIRIYSKKFSPKGEVSSSA